MVGSLSDPRALPIMNHDVTPVLVFAGRFFEYLLAAFSDLDC